MKLLLDFLPILLFFGMFKYAEGHRDWASATATEWFGAMVSGGNVGPTEAPVLLATVVVIAATLVQIGWMLARGKKIEPMLWISLVLVVGLGGATIYFHDIAGLVKGASEGEGLGNKFLASIRETDAICHVVRAHDDSGVPHPDGSVHPLRDIETIETELVLSDYEQTERRLERVTKQARSGDAEAIAERDWLEKVRDALAEGRPTRSVPRASMR